MKIKLFAAREIQYFELEIFSFNSYVYYLTRGFVASIRACNLLTRACSLPARAFNLSTRAFSVLTREFELVTRRFELVTRKFELVTREFKLVTRGFELVTRGFELVTRNSCFTFPHSNLVYKFKCNICSDIYYGKAKLHFKVRALEHLGATPLAGKKVKNPKRKSSI